MAAEKPVETETDMLTGPDKPGVPVIAEQGITVVVGANMTEAQVVPDQGKVAVEVPALPAKDRTVAGRPALAVGRRPATEMQAG